LIELFLSFQISRVEVEDHDSEPLDYYLILCVKEKIMCSLEACVPLSSDDRSFYQVKSNSPALTNLQSTSIQRLMKICFPIQLQHVYSKKRQDLLCLLLNSLSKTSQRDYHDVVLMHMLEFLESADFNDVVWINCCESGFLHRLLRKLFHILSEEKKITYVSFILRKLQLTAISKEKEQPFQKRNRLLILQEFLHIIGTTTTAKWLESHEILAVIGKKIGKEFIFDNEFTSVLAIKILIAFRTILNEIISSTNDQNGFNTINSMENPAIRESVRVYFQVSELIFLQKKEFYEKSLNEISLLICLKTVQLLKDDSVVIVSKVSRRFFFFFWLICCFLCSISSITSRSMAKVAYLLP
jgi:hypothetical protein